MEKTRSVVLATATFLFGAVVSEKGVANTFDATNLPQTFSQLGGTAVCNANNVGARATITAKVGGSTLVLLAAPATSSLLHLPPIKEIMGPVAVGHA
jgi:hypothetical protein